ncbi:hypothetical protein JL720_10704 [Aureococcus anophagefferens]|nr:hypothetical protein JL720_10704 [Aureococcus anophagefferens]
MDTSADPEEDPMQAAFDAASELQGAAKSDALVAILTGFADAPLGEAGVRLKEDCIYALATLNVGSGNFDFVVGLLSTAAPFFALVAKAKVAKIVRRLLEIAGESGPARRPPGGPLRARHRLNIPKAKAALTAARASGNAVYGGPSLQAQLDEMSGTLHCEEQDYHTAHSYFLEAYEGYDGLDDGPRATRCLKYMLLCQILQEPEPGSARSATASLDAATAAATSKQYVKYAGPQLDAMAGVARAAKARSLEAFEATTSRYGAELQADLLIKHHLGLLYDTILENNLAKIIEPFSCVEIDRVAELIALPKPKVEKKLAQMILDKKLTGVLAQGEGRLMLHTEPNEDPTYEASLAVIKNTADAVGRFGRAAPSTRRSGTPRPGRVAGNGAARRAGASVHERAARGGVAGGARAREAHGRRPPVHAAEHAVDDAERDERAVVEGVDERRRAPRRASRGRSCRRERAEEAEEPRARGLGPAAPARLRAGRAAPVRRPPPAVAPRRARASS